MDDRLSQLERLAALRASGALSDAEFTRLKAELMLAAPMAAPSAGSSSTAPEPAPAPPVAVQPAARGGVPSRRRRGWFLAAGLAVAAVVAVVSWSQPKSSAVASRNRARGAERPTMAGVAGFYSGRDGLGWNTTMELSPGGRFVQKSPSLRNGVYVGEWALSGGEIVFYGGGSVLYRARLRDNGFVLNGLPFERVR